MDEGRQGIDVRSNGSEMKDDVKRGRGCERMK